MIRTRLAIAFSALALLALAQSVFAWWAASTAAQLPATTVTAPTPEPYLEPGLTGVVGSGTQKRPCIS